MTAQSKRLIAISGATGFVGLHLCKAFRERGFEILPLGRKDFDLHIDALADKLQGCEVIVNLAGAPIIQRWTAEHKKVMYDSRINVTSKLVEACSKMNQKPALFISTSAIGYYAENGTHTEEHHTRAENFLGNLAKDWEEEAVKAEALDIRTVIFRLGVVLGKDGGALKEMLLPFKLGLGGNIGSGRQPFSWIHIQDLIRAYIAVIDSPSYSGIYNLTAPNPTTNRGLTKALGKALFRPTFLHIPKCVLKLQLGEGAQVLIGGQRVLPERLLAGKFEFLFPDIEKAIQDCVS